MQGRSMPAGEDRGGEVPGERQVGGHAAADVEQLNRPELGFGLQDVRLGGHDGADLVIAQGSDHVP